MFSVSNFVDSQVFFCAFLSFSTSFQSFHYYFCRYVCFLFNLDFLSFLCLLNISCLRFVLFSIFPLIFSRVLFYFTIFYAWFLLYVSFYIIILYFSFFFPIFLSNSSSVWASFFSFLSLNFLSFFAVKLAVYISSIFARFSSIPFEILFF